MYIHIYIYIYKRRPATSRRKRRIPHGKKSQAQMTKSLTWRTDGLGGKGLNALGSTKKLPALTHQKSRRKVFQQVHFKQ